MSTMDITIIGETSSSSSITCSSNRKNSVKRCSSTTPLQKAPKLTITTVLSNETNNTSNKLNDITKDDTDMSYTSTTTTSIFPNSNGPTLTTSADNMEASPSTNAPPTTLVTTTSTPGTSTTDTYITRLILTIQSALNALGCDGTSSCCCPQHDQKRTTLGDDDLTSISDTNNTNKDYTNDEEEILSKIEAMAIFVHGSMSIGSRDYHSVQHVFDILSSSEDETFRKDPIAILAGVFHDCIYYNIDGGFTPSQAEKLHGAICDVMSAPAPAPVTTSTSSSSTSTTTVATIQPLPKLKIHPDADQDELLRMVLMIFNFLPDQELNPFCGQNEFLSALVAVRTLQTLVPFSILVQIATCIEATIPFRPIVNNETPMDRLYQNVQRTNTSFNLQFTEMDMVRMVQRAVLLSNEDVGNFASSDQSWFLDNTWSLLPESNAALRHSFLYTISEFQFAVFKMYGFFNYLQPSVIFQEFRNVPPTKEYTDRIQRAEENLLIGQKYIAAKLISITFLAALAELTGGDTPISLFMGDLPSRTSTTSRPAKRLEDTLAVELLDSDSSHSTNEFQNNMDELKIPDSSSDDTIATPANGDNDVVVDERPASPPQPRRISLLMSETLCPSHCHKMVYKLLIYGRGRETSFDVKQSPLAGYFYYHLGDEKIRTILKGINVYPMNRIVAKEFLLNLPPATVKYVASQVSVIAFSRSHRIEELVNDMYK